MTPRRRRLPRRLPPGAGALQRKLPPGAPWTAPCPPATAPARCARPLLPRPLAARGPGEPCEQAPASLPRAAPGSGALGAPAGHRGRARRQLHLCGGAWSLRSWAGGGQGMGGRGSLGEPRRPGSGEQKKHCILLFATCAGSLAGAQKPSQQQERRKSEGKGQRNRERREEKEREESKEKKQ